MQKILGNKHYKPDFTAWFVLQGTIVTMHQKEFYDVNNEPSLKLYKILALESGKTRLLSQITPRLPYSWQSGIGDFVTNSGRMRHFYLRKQEIAKQTRKLLDSGVKKIIVLGAGFDVLSLRFAQEYPDVKFIEIDLPESQEFKLAAFAAHNIKIPENVEFIAGDLCNPLSEILSQSKLHDHTAKTLWIAEGLLMFIPEKNVIDIFKHLKENCAEESYCIFTTIEPTKYGTSIAWLIQKLYLRKEKCPFKWAIESEKLPEFIKELGFSVIEQINCKLLHKSYISNKSDINHNIGDDIHIVKI